MSLIPIGAVPFTTEEDRRRRPVISSGQLVRTLVLFAVFVVAMAFVARGGATSLPPGPARGIDVQQ